MIDSSVLRVGAAALALIAASGAAAQAIVPQPTPNADALATQVRLLAANPRNVAALIAAGELSTKLADIDAAMAFFARAEAVDPRNPRIAAGRAGALVMMERPGEALRLYAQAERAGLAMSPYLAQRGLAHDLTGQPGYAQRDYRQALQAGPDDETTRRLALSLGIAGKREQAMALLDPLLRRSDRAAWRARACILALAGDMAGADRIAATTLPGGTALGPFFRRLPTLSPADRAFAVHFGELNTTAARIADARLAPTLPVLPAEPEARPVAVAAATPAPLPVATARRSGRIDRARRRTQQASARPSVSPRTAPPAQVASAPRLRAVTPAASGRTETPDTPQPPSRPPTSVTAMTPGQPTVAALAPQPLQPDAQAPQLPTPSPAPSSATVASQVATARTPLPYEVIDAPRPARVVSPPPAAALPPPRRRANEALLASIVASIEVPQSEREDRRAADPAPTPRAPAAATRATPAKRPAGTNEKPKPVADADPKAKTAPSKKKPDAPKPEAARWWVQVAGGARAADLDKDWKRLSDKSAALKGKSAYATPVRATNRLLTGPFKTEAEARGVVNALAKEGKSAFTFQSAMGQKVDRLDAK